MRQRRQVKECGHCRRIKPIQQFPADEKPKEYGWCDVCLNNQQKSMINNKKPRPVSRFNSWR